MTAISIKPAEHAPEVPRRSVSEYSVFARICLEAAKKPTEGLTEEQLIHQFAELTGANEEELIGRLAVDVVESDK